MQAFTVAARSDLPFSDEVSVKILNSVDEMAASNEKTFSLELENAMTPKVTSTPVVDITPSMCDGELRVLDVDLAKYLGFTKAANIRTLIKRHLPALERFSTVFTAQTVKRGQKTTEYYLDKRQATFITTQSGTENAIDITIQLIERFDAYERGEITSGKSPAVGDDEAAKIAFHTAHEIMKEVLDASEGDRILIAARIAQKTTGINPLASLGIDELPTVSLKKTSMRDKWREKGRSGSAKGKRASERRGGCSFVELSPSEKYITATRIGQLIGMTARDVNKVLAEMGSRRKSRKIIQVIGLCSRKERHTLTWKW